MCIKPLETDFTISGDIHYEGETYKKYINEKWVQKNIKRQTYISVVKGMEHWPSSSRVQCWILFVI